MAWPLFWRRLGALLMPRVPPPGSSPSSLHSRTNRPVVRARTRAELIRELDGEALHATNAALVVRLTGTPLLIWSSDPGRIETLDSALAEGGEPVGVLQHADGRVSTRPFCEYSDSDSATAILETLRKDPPQPPSD